MLPAQAAIGFGVSHASRMTFGSWRKAEEHVGNLPYGLMKHGKLWVISDRRGPLEWTIVEMLRRHRMSLRPISLMVV